MPIASIGRHRQDRAEPISLRHLSSNQRLLFCNRLVPEAWAKLACLGRVESERHLNGEVTIEQRYYIASIDNDAQRLAEAVRAHWGIENCVHWVLIA